jgi:hypothetical protein
MANIQAIIFYIEVGAFVAAVLLTLWSLADAVIAKGKSKYAPRVYEDKDGAATAETQAEYSLFWPNVALGAIVGAGLAAAIVEGTIAYRYGLSSRSGWADVAVWVSDEDEATQSREES